VTVAGPAARCFGIVPHLTRPAARELCLRLAARIEAAGGSVVVPAGSAVRTGLDAWAVPEAGFADGLDLVLSVGGDGTMLTSIDLVGRAGVPVLGVNVGHLGYLTAVAPADAEERVDDVLAGRYLVEERMMLEVEVRHPDGRGHGFRALNEAVLEKRVAGNLIRLAVSFNGVAFTEYAADGFIVATPTGSTAYAFSARGPIVSPLMRAIVVVPVSAHMLFDRSLVLDHGETVGIMIKEGREASLFVDGRDAGLLEEGAVVEVRESAVPARFVTFEHRDFHAILKLKFGLPDRLPDGL
jgi:NAD+ kinase